MKFSQLFILITTLMAGCCPSNNDVEPHPKWELYYVGSNICILTDPANGQEYICNGSGGITPRLK